MKHLIIILTLLTATIQTFAQSPRIKLNQITKDSLSGSVLISSPTDSGMVYSRDLFISYGADTVLILNGDTLAATSGIISSVLSDGVTITGDGTGGSPLTVDTTTYIATKGDLDAKQDQLNGTGFVKATGTTISYDNSTYLTSEVDGSITNEIQDISTTGAAGNISISSGSTLNLNVDDADASASNELQTLSYNSSTNEIILSDGGGTEDLSNLDLVDSTRINATGDTAYYYQNGVLIGTGAIAGGGGGTTYNNITEGNDTVYISDHLVVDDSLLYVDATNNRIGINTNNPQYRMDFSYTGATDNNHFQNGLIISNDDPSYNVLALALNSKTKNANLGFLKNDTVKVGMAYDTRGFFGIVNSVYAFQDFGFRLYDDGSFVYYDVPNDSTSFKIEADGGIFAPRLLNASTGNTMYYNTTSDEISYSSSSIRFKDEIEDLPIGLNELMKLKPSRYTYLPDGQKDYGYIAEQVYDVGLTEFVTFNQEQQIEGLKDKYFMVLHTKAIQEQQSIIEQQTTEIDQLKELITDLTNRLITLENK